MGAKVCPRCVLSLPGSGYDFCPICFGPTAYHIWAYPDEDWRERIKAAEVAHVTPDKTDMNRAKRLLATGLDHDTALEYAQARRTPSINDAGGGYEVDVWEFERLVAKCGVALAAQIMKPLS